MRRVALLLVAVLLGAPDAWPGKGQPSVDGERLEFELPDLDGSIVRSSDTRFADKVLLIDLWGTWCPPCVSETPTFVDLQDRLGERGFVIVAIAFEGIEDADERRAHVRDFVDERGINYLVLDGGTTENFEQALPQMRNVRGFPVEILIGRDGRVVETKNGYGYRKKWARKLEQSLDELLGSR